VARGALVLVLATAACLDPLPVPPQTEIDDEFDQGSQVASQELTGVQVENLALLGKVWGFAKYHDARVITGSVNWDYELFRVLPTVLAAADRPAATAAIVTWLDRHGTIRDCGPCASAASNVQLAPDLAWISDAASLGATLSARLVAIHRSRPANGRQRYVAFSPTVGNPDFSAEARHQGQSTPDAGYRLLALFRFWNIIQYWFPYREVIGEPWDNVLHEYIPRMLRPMTGTEYRGAMIQLSARINDTHANVWSQLFLQPPTGSFQVPVALRFIDGRPVVTAYLNAVLGPATGLQIGDVIERVDGVAVGTIVDSLRLWYSASNEPTRLRDMAEHLLRGSGPVVIGGSRATGPFEVTASRSPYTQFSTTGWQRDRPGPAFQMLSDSVAYVKISTALRVEASSYVTQALSARVLVIDIRNYPGDFPIFALGGHLVAASTPFAKFTIGSPSNPGSFAFGPTVSLTPAQPRFTGQVVVLVDEVTQSSAEYHAMAFRAAPNAIVVGSTTAGADGNVSPIPLPGGIESMMSGIGVFYPNGTPTQRVGIVPDFEVRPTVEGIRAGRDEVLEAGVARGFAASAGVRTP
jgi:C-terminal processing protease CtpA/Prc